MRTSHFAYRHLCAAVLALIGTAGLALPGTAADFDGGCCADLEERIAELEQTAARTGGDKLEVTVTGTVNHGVLFWDDGEERNTYVVTNDNDGDAFAFEGEVELEDAYEGWKMGFEIEIDVISAGSGDVNQFNDDGEVAVELGDAAFFISNERLGTLSIGVTSARGPSDGANESDLSDTEVLGFVAMQDIGGGFMLRRAGLGGGRGLIELAWEDLIDPLDQPDGNIVAYDTPTFGGLSGSIYWGEDDVWNVGLGLEREIEDVVKVRAAIGYSEDREGTEEDLGNFRQVVGSFAILHVPTGLNLAVSGGWREYTDLAELNDDTFAAPDDVSFFYVKAGLIRRFNRLGKTAFYAEYGRFRDFQGNAAEGEVVAGLAGIDEDDVCDGAGVACLSASSTGQAWGLGAVQFIDSAEAQLYVGYRHFSADVDLVDSNGTSVPTVPLNDFDVVIAGMLIEF